jgi:hypothetical protein
VPILFYLFINENVTPPAGGRNILSEEYTLACKVAEAQYAELAATFKNRSVPDSEYFQDQLVNGRSGFGSGSESAK